MQEVVGTQRLGSQGWLLEKVVAELNLKEYVVVPQKKESGGRNSTCKGPEAGVYGVLGAASSLTTTGAQSAQGVGSHPSAAVRLKQDDRHDHAFMFLLREQTTRRLPPGRHPSFLVLSCQFFYNPDGKRGRSAA